MVMPEVDRGQRIWVRTTLPPLGRSFFSVAVLFDGDKNAAYLCPCPTHPTCIPHDECDMRITKDTCRFVSCLRPLRAGKSRFVCPCTRHCLNYGRSSMRTKSILISCLAMRLTARLSSVCVPGCASWPSLKVDVVPTWAVTPLSARMYASAISA